MRKTGRFGSQRNFDDLLKLVKELSVVENYEHDTVYIDSVGEDVEMLKFRLWGEDHYEYIYVKPKWYMLKVIKVMRKNLIELWRP